MSRRLFVALTLPDWLRDELELLLPKRGDDSDFPRARWVPADNLHLTLLFLGQQPDDCLNPLIEALRESTSGAKRIETEVEEVGAFPPDGARRGSQKKVLWLGLEPVPELMALHQGVCSAVVRAIPTFSLEERPFVPHLTLARMRPPWPRDPFLRAVSHFAPLTGRALQLQSLHLIESKVDQTGATYTPLAEVCMT